MLVAWLGCTSEQRATLDIFCQSQIRWKSRCSHHENVKGSFESGPGMSTSMQISCAVFFDLTASFVQVIDLSEAGPSPGLDLMKGLPSFRAIGCGGDGTIGWILQEADRKQLQNCQLGVLPLGTGNDLSRVLGWGGSFSDDYEAMSNFIDCAEKSKLQMFDRWGIAVDTSTVLPPLPPKRLSVVTEGGDGSGASAPPSPGRSRRPSSSTTPESAFMSVKRVGRFLRVFFSSCANLFAGEERSAAGDVSVDDLTGMIEEFTQHVRDLLDCQPPSASDAAAVRDIERSCDAIQTETNLFVSSLFADDAGDSEAEATLNSLRDMVENCIAACQRIVPGVSSENRKDSPSADRGVSRKFRAARAAGSPEMGPDIEKHDELPSRSGIVKRVSQKLLGRGRRASQPAVTPLEFGDVKGEVKFAMNNYFGVGLDAKVCPSCCNMTGPSNLQSPRTGRDGLRHLS